MYVRTHVRMGIYDSSERHANPYVIYSNIRYGKQVVKNILLNIKLPHFLWSALTVLLLIAAIHRLYVFVGSCLSLPVTHEKHCRSFAPNVNRNCKPGCCLSVPSAKTCKRDRAFSFSIPQQAPPPPQIRRN